MKKLLETILTISTKELATFLKGWCEVNGDKYWIKLPYKGFNLSSKKDMRVWCFSHIDKKQTNEEIEVLYDPKKRVAWSPSGLGADDRAGVYACIQMFKRLPAKQRPVIVFCDEEERGAHGAREFTKTHRDDVISNCLAMLEFDRRGEEEAVFYNQETKVFKKKIKKGGWTIGNGGSFSDISHIGKETRICGANLSVGYYNQHTYYERLEIEWLERTISKAIAIIPEIKKEKKQYKLGKNEEKPKYQGTFYGSQWQDGYNHRSNTLRGDIIEMAKDMDKEDVIKKWNIDYNHISKHYKQCDFCMVMGYTNTYGVKTICAWCIRNNPLVDNTVNQHYSSSLLTVKDDNGKEGKGKSNGKDNGKGNGGLQKAGEIIEATVITRCIYWCQSCRCEFPDIHETGIYYGNHCPNCFQEGALENYIKEPLML